MTLTFTDDVTDTTALLDSITVQSVTSSDNDIVEIKSYSLGSSGAGTDSKFERVLTISWLPKKLGNCTVVIAASDKDGSFTET